MSLAPDSGSGFSGSQLGGAGMLALGGAGLGYMLSQGPAPLPDQFKQLEANVPGMEAEAGVLQAEGQTMYGQGAQALEMAQNGILTAPQQAQLTKYNQGLQNVKNQTFASMGRNSNQDTSNIAATADIDAKVNAMAQQQIQSTIQLGLGEVSSGNQYSSTGLGYENAANQALIAAGTAQLQQDKNYSDSLTGVFKAIGSMAPAALKMMAL